MEHRKNSSEKICNVLGLPGFSTDPLLINSIKAIRLLLKPSFHSEICISIILSQEEQALLQVNALSKSLWYSLSSPSFPLLPFFTFERFEILTEMALNLLFETENSLKFLLEKPDDSTCNDGISCSLVFFKDGKFLEYEGNAYGDERLAKLVSPYIKFAARFSKDSVCQQALNDMAEYGLVEALFSEIKEEAPFTNLLFLGAKEEVIETTNVMKKLAILDSRQQSAFIKE